METVSSDTLIGLPETIYGLTVPPFAFSVSPLT